jgi:hypothetical protein
MSGSNDFTGRGAGLTAVSGAAVLPFTGSNHVVSIVLVTAVVCAVLVLGVKLAKRFMERG